MATLREATARQPTESVAGQVTAAAAAAAATTAAAAASTATTLVVAGRRFESRPPTAVVVQEARPQPAKTGSFLSKMLHRNNNYRSFRNKISCSSLSYSRKRSTNSVPGSKQQHRQQQHDVIKQNQQQQRQQQLHNDRLQQQPLQSPMLQYYYDDAILNYYQFGQEEPLNVMQWLEYVCPKDIIPLILAFCGPQKMLSIGRINRYWCDLVQQEATWRTLCEELYKWNEGDEVPDSWSEYYRLHPCVPVDYFSISRAIQVTGRQLPNSDIHVLLRPGRFITKEPVVIDAPQSITVTVQSMQLPNNLFSPSIYAAATSSMSSSTNNIGTLSTTVSNDTTNTNITSSGKGNKTRNSFRSLMSCKSASAVQVIEEVRLPPNADDYERFYANGKRAHIYSPVIRNTSRQNEPIFRLSQGNLLLKGIDLIHSSNGIDIWNGNAAVQVQPLVNNNNNNDGSNPRSMSSAVLDQVEITSKTGRGVVTIDGGYVEVKNSCIRDCAATGIYIGGQGSKAEVFNSDIIHNGIGSRTTRRGIAPGHSGIYLEQGHADINNCNVSHNALTGISAISNDNCVLQVEESDLMSNGSIQIELPPPGTLSRRNSVTRNNRLDLHGIPRYRSGLAGSIPPMRRGTPNDAAIVTPGVAAAADV